MVNYYKYIAAFLFIWRLIDIGIVFYGFENKILTENSNQESETAKRTENASNELEKRAFTAEQELTRLEEEIENLKVTLDQLK
jgi:uncharacterized protein YlxW (UPF0749 family)